MTKTALTQAKYAKIITKHRKRFSAGGKLTRKQLTKWFNVQGVVHEGTAKEVQKANLRLVQAQTDINRLLRTNGLHLRSRNYYSEFYIANKNETERVVLNYKNKAIAHQHCGEELGRALVKLAADGVWGNYSAERTSSSTPRHTSIATSIAAK